MTLKKSSYRRDGKGIHQDEKRLKRAGLLPEKTLATIPRNTALATTPKNPLAGYSCAIGLQVGTRTFTDTGIVASGVFGLTGWEDPCTEPVAVRCQLAINGKPAPYFWYACNNPAHQKEAWRIEHYGPDGKVTHVTQGVRMLEEPHAPQEVPALKAKPKRKAKTMGEKLRDKGWGKT